MITMFKNRFFLGFLLAVLISLLNASVAQGEISVGVAGGDWIEYAVTTTGNPPEQFDVTWAKMQVLKVEGPVIKTNVTTKFANGTLSSLTMTLNLEKGEIGAWFIIPANLAVGDSFLDSNCQKVTIQGEQQLSWAGDSRVLTNAITSQRIKQWDKLTGVFVECIDVFDDYTINATAIKTSMWGNQGAIGSPLLKPEWLVIILAISTLALGIGVLGWIARKVNVSKGIGPNDVHEPKLSKTTG
jgi:hypothetical protein